jgi:hypothetical protein
MIRVLAGPNSGTAGARPVTERSSVAA